jgi:hypothetical protein
MLQTVVKTLERKMAELNDVRCQSGSGVGEEGVECAD